MFSGVTKENDESGENLMEETPAPEATLSYEPEPSDSESELSGDEAIKK